MKKFPFYLLMMNYLVLVLADGILTYVNTPDLTMEGNPLVADLGLGWTALAVANILALIVIFCLGYYTRFRYKTKYTEQTRFTHYCSQIIYDRPDRFWTGVIPKHITPFVAMLGFCLPYAAILSRAIVVGEWLYITFTDFLAFSATSYAVLTQTYFYGRVDIAASILVGLVLEFWWLYREFKTQLPKSP